MILGSGFMMFHDVSWIHGAIKVVYWWDPWHTIYSSTMDPMGDVSWIRISNIVCSGCLGAKAKPLSPSEPINGTTSTEPHLCFPQLHRQRVNTSGTRLFYNRDFDLLGGCAISSMLQRCFKMIWGWGWMTHEISRSANAGHVHFIRALDFSASHFQFVFSQLALNWDWGDGISWYIMGKAVCTVRLRWSDLLGSWGLMIKNDEYIKKYMNNARSQSSHLYWPGSASHLEWMNIW